MSEFKRGEKWGRDRILKDILMSEEFYKYHVDNPVYNINIQQASKTPVLMDCMVAGPGRKFVELDITALEQVVISELSGDKTYIELFASGKPHDPYLFIAIKLLPSGKAINAVYNVDSPTKDSVKAAKKEFKTDRTVGKLFQLMSAYKAGAPKIRRALLLNDIEITKEEAQALRKKYWGPELFGGVVEWEDNLLQEVKDRGGFLLNGLGMPFAIPEHKEKDVMNVVCQSTGSMLVQLWLWFTWKEIEKRDLWEKIYPAVDDFHDETVLSVEEGYEQAASECLTVGLQRLNSFINPQIPLSGGVEISDDFTGFKQPDKTTNEWYEKKVEQWNIGQTSKASRATKSVTSEGSATGKKKPLVRGRKKKDTST